MARTPKTNQCGYCNQPFGYERKSQKYCGRQCSGKAIAETKTPEVKCAKCHAIVGVRITASAILLNKNKSTICAFRRENNLANLHAWKRHENNQRILDDAKQRGIITTAWKEEYKSWIASAMALDWRDPTPAYERQKEKARIKYAENREYFREYQKRVYSTPEQRAKRSAYNKEWSRRNKDKIKLLSKKYRKENPDKFRQFARKQRSKPIVRIRESLSRRLRELVGTVNGKSRSVGCTSSFLKDHIQSQFVNGMTWSNYGTVWHIDHIRPLASFDLLDPAQRDIANNWSNLRPMFADENMAKGDKILNHAELGGNLFGWAA